MAGDSKAKVIPLHGNSGSTGARGSRRVTASKRHPSALPKPSTGTAEEIEAVIREFDQRRAETSEPTAGDLTQRIAAFADFVRKM